MAFKLKLLSFGDVFRYKEEDYIYLARTEDVFYTARILSVNDTALVLKQSNTTRASRPGVQSPLYCFVILSTEGFNERMAHLFNPDKNEVNIYTDKYCSINPGDLKALKKEILDPETLVPRQLKDLVKDIEIPE